MTSTAQQPDHDFVLTPQQQRLLFAALNANKASGSPANNSLQANSVSPLDDSPLQESPLIDYEYEYGDPNSSLDFSFDDGDQPKMIGDLPTGPSTIKSDSAEMESPDKRSHPDDDDEEEIGAKRREGEDKVAKKPGRKPLTTEPSSKRKAQNRAAQRAFRERKEKHLKDLETKVQELEQASEAANHENELLRAKVDRMTVELGEYKKRLSSTPSAPPSSSARPPRGATFGQAFVNNINDVNFQFEFPKFGSLPGPPTGAKGTGFKSSSNSSPASNTQSNGWDKPGDDVSPTSSSGRDQFGQPRLGSTSTNGFSSYSDVLYNSLASSNGNSNGNSGNNTDSGFSQGGQTNTSSPSSCSNSNTGPSSSCGTSPEPCTQSPAGSKPLDTLTTIGEEQPTLNGSNQGFGDLANMDLGNFSWLPQDNFQFDPALFNTYRESNEATLPGGDLDDSFFNDAFDNIDFTTPYNVPVTAGSAKKDLISQIDAAKNADALDCNDQLLTCNNIWEKLQNCPKVQSGDFDLDGLCSDLQKKAKCSGSGAVVDEKDFKNVMQKYLGKPDDQMSTCGFFLEKEVMGKTAAQGTKTE